VSIHLCCDNLFRISRISIAVEHAITIELGVGIYVKQCAIHKSSGYIKIPTACLRSFIFNNFYYYYLAYIVVY